MKCFSCGSDISDMAAFCPFCGAKQSQGAQAGDASDAQVGSDVEAGFTIGAEMAPAPECSPSGEAASESMSDDVPSGNVEQGDAFAPDAGFAVGPDSDGAANRGTSVAASAVGEGPSAASETATAPGASPIKKPSLRKKPALIAGIVAAVIAVIAVAVFVVVGADRVSDETLKTTLEQSSIVKSGLVPQNYVDSSDYKVKDLKITDQKKITDTGAFSSVIYALTGTSGENIPIMTVSYKATIENDNFSSDIVGTVQFLKWNDQWLTVAAPSASTLQSCDTKPLKGVDKMDAQSSSSSSYSYGSKQDYTIDHDDFEATFDESDSSYSSTATEKVSYSFWFAKDSATASQSFKFDQKSGWQPTGNVKLSDQDTVWNLEGKTFKYEKDASDAKTTASITFKTCSSDNLTADHSITYAPSEKAKKSNYLDASASGEAKGKPTHKFGENSFSVELNDASSKVTYKINGITTVSVAGSGTVDALDNCSVDTKLVYWQNSSGSSKSELGLSWVDFVEQV